MRYLIAGGLAVVAHGHFRFTADVVLEANNARKAMEIFKSLGYVPRAPVPLEQFADSAIAESWIREKGLKVFSLFSEQHPQTVVDCFVEAPLPFDEAFRRAVKIPFTPGLEGYVVSLEDLYLKKQAGRPNDVDDIRTLMAIHGLSDE